jgi:PDZ domain-containing secreted protein
LVVAVVVLLGGSLVAYGFVGANGYYVLAPGNAPVVTASPSCRPAGGGSFALANGTPCVQLDVPGGGANVDGSIMMVDVLESKPTPLQFLAWKGAQLPGLGFLSHIYGTDEFLPNAAILGNGSASQLNCEDTEQAIQATSAAPVAALRQIGYTVTENDLGAQIDQVVNGTPAAAAGLQCDDLVTAVDGTKITTYSALDAAIRAHRPGQTVSLTVQRSGSSGQTRTLTLTARLTGTPALQGQPAVPGRAFLGVEPETRTTYNLPLKISANVGSIGGPSDGLALALGFIDALSHGKLTNGLKIAATGEIDAKGTVYEIGGAAQKAVAVRNAGATVFLVPTANYSDAKSQAGRLKVLAVSNLQQALDDLQALGGQVPGPVSANPAASAAAGPANPAASAAAGPAAPAGASASSVIVQASGARDRRPI